MKSIKLYASMMLVLLAFVSCNKDNFSMDLSEKPFVRLNKTLVSITVGEKYRIQVFVDSLGSASKTFNWTIADSNIATIEASDGRSAVITGLGEGKTVIKIKSTDGELKYFSDLNVDKDRVIKILAIGNSFSDDAIEHYLHDLVKASGRKALIANLYFGGRSLQTH